MTIKKVVGYLFIVLAIILSISIIARIADLYTSIFGFFKIFTGTLNSYETGRVVGMLLYWVIHFAVTFLLFKYGLKWIKKGIK